MQITWVSTYANFPFTRSPDAMVYFLGPGFCIHHNLRLGPQTTFNGAKCNLEKAHPSGALLLRLPRHTFHRHTVWPPRIGGPWRRSSGNQNRVCQEQKDRAYHVRLGNTRVNGIILNSTVLELRTPSSIQTISAAHGDQATMAQPPGLRGTTQWPGAVYWYSSTAVRVQIQGG